MLRSVVKLSTGVALLVTAVAPAWSSSHREAPNITELRKVDNTDVYAFRSYEPDRAGFTTLISNFQPDQGPGNGPNYYTLDPNAVYEIHIDNNGDAVEDVTFQFKFTNRLKGFVGCTRSVGNTNPKVLSIALRHDGQITAPNDPNLCETESYTVKMISGDRRDGTVANITNASGGATSFLKPFDNAGNKSIPTPPGYPAYSDQFIFPIAIPNCAAGGKVFVGQREEQFAVNLGPIFDLVNLVPIQGAPDPIYDGGMPFAGGITQSDDNQELINKRNITSIALEVPTACLTGTGNGVIGVWSTASLPQSRLLKTNPTYAAPDTQGGALVQVSRLGMPLVNELVIGIKDKDLFNAAEPTQDVALADYVTHPTFPEILQELFGVQAPNNFPRNDLVATFLTGFNSLNQLATVTPSEMLRLNTAVTATPQASQHPLGVVANDLAGFPNGRRPGDDTVDIVLRVAMGRLCHPIPIGSLGLCMPADAPNGLTPFTDGAPSNASYVMNRFPYLNPALRGAPRPQTTP